MGHHHHKHKTTWGKIKHASKKVFETIKSDAGEVKEFFTGDANSPQNRAPQSSRDIQREIERVRLQRELEALKAERRANMPTPQEKITPAQKFFRGQTASLKRVVPMGSGQFNNRATTNSILDLTGKSRANPNVIKNMKRRNALPDLF